MDSLSSGPHAIGGKKRGRKPGKTGKGILGTIGNVVDDLFGFGKSSHSIGGKRKVGRPRKGGNESHSIGGKRTVNHSAKEQAKMKAHAKKVESMLKREIVKVKKDLEKAHKTLSRLMK